MRLSHNTLGILLAAGGSTRFGQSKQLLMWHGQPLIAHTIMQLLAAGCERIAVVLGADAPACRQRCEEALEPHSKGLAAVTWLLNPDWKSGQASSLRVALKFLASLDDKPAHFLIALCDQPLLLSTHYQRLIESASAPPVRVAATQYSEGGGVPACFRYDCLHQLSMLEKDAGAKAWIRQLDPAHLQLLDFGREIRDVDTPIQWQQLNAS